MRPHGEPERRVHRRCAACGLPLSDPAKKRVLTEAAEARDPSQTWTWCLLCGNETCRALQELCAEDAEREAEDG